MKVEVSQLNRSVSIAQYMPPLNTRSLNPLIHKLGFVLDTGTLDELN